MTTLTLDLPDALARKLREQQMSEQEAEALLLAALEVLLEQLGNAAPRHGPAQGRFGESAIPFARKLIAQNRSLFELLAKR